MLPTRRGKLAISENLIDRRVIAETGTIPSGMQLIRDTFAFQVLDKKNVVVEGKNGKEEPAVRVTGLFQEGDIENANGRVYDAREVLAPAVQSIQEDISSRAVMGEYDHPADAKIHLDRVSHLITKIWMEGRKVYGEAEVLHKLPCGACLRGLFEHNIRVGISSRGVGDMEVVESGGQEKYKVLPGYSFVTWDAVAEPSVSNAILNIREGLEQHLKPLKKSNGMFDQKIYQDMVVEEINKYFGLK
jgi:hypothetical protein